MVDLTAAEFLVRAKHFGFKVETKKLFRVSSQTLLVRKQVAYDSGTNFLIQEAKREGEALLTRVPRIGAAAPGSGMSWSAHPQAPSLVNIEISITDVAPSFMATVAAHSTREREEKARQEDLAGAFRIKVQAEINAHPEVVSLTEKLIATQAQALQQREELIQKRQALEDNLSDLADTFLYVTDEREI